MSILNLGSLNVDRVLAVDHLAAAGETIAARSLAMFAGGKGANQSVALARAGAQVAHAGKIGADGAWMLEKLAVEGVDTSLVEVGPGSTGQAIIQVDAAGENSIVIWPGANDEITPDDVDRTLAAAPPGSWLLVQNETSSVDYAIRSAHQLGLLVALNPAPFNQRAREYPLELVHLLCVNQTEGAALTGEHAAERMADALADRLRDCEILLTLGASGARYRHGDVDLQCAAPRVAAVDTTAAGDTFLGYFLAARAAGSDPAACLQRACRAAAVCVTRPGAMDSIPRSHEISDVD
jgi:ribokinase